VYKVHQNTSVMSKLLTHQQQLSGQWQTGAFTQFTKNYATVTHTTQVSEQMYIFTS